MKNKLLSFCMFLREIAKWGVLSVVTGLSVGAIAAGFIWLIDKVCGFTYGFKYYYFALPFALFLSAFIIKKLAPTAEGHGTEKAIEAIHQKNGRINIAVIPVKAAATVITIAAGGSVGREGPTTQIGAGAASFLARLFRLSGDDGKRLVICGMSAAFAAIFGTPIAAAVFAVEVLIVGRLNLKKIFPVMLAAVVGFLTAKALGVGTESLSGLAMGITESSLIRLLPVAFVSGIFFGLVSMLTITVLNFVHKLAQKIRIYKPLKGLIGGIVLVLLTLAFGKNYLGMGTEYFTAIITGEDRAALYGFILKIVFTAVTLSFGGSGGVLMPLMFIGATAGGAFANVFHLNQPLFACLGMFAVLASSTNTPLACVVMTLEMIGSPLFTILAAVACPVSYLVTGHRSVYPSQLLTESKTGGIWLESTVAGHPKERLLGRRGGQGLTFECFLVYNNRHASYMSNPDIRKASA